MPHRPPLLGGRLLVVVLALLLGALPPRDGRGLAGRHEARIVPRAAASSTARLQRSSPESAAARGLKRVAPPGTPPHPLLHASGWAPAVFAHAGESAAPTRREPPRRALARTPYLANPPPAA